MKTTYVIVDLIVVLLTVCLIFAVYLYLPNTKTTEIEKTVTVDTYLCYANDVNNYYHSSVNCDNKGYRGSFSATTLIEAENSGKLYCHLCHPDIDNLSKIQKQIPVVSKTTTQINKLPYLTALSVSGIIALGLCIFSQTFSLKRKVLGDN